MYFEKFPKTVYTLDEYKSGQIVTDILRRTKFVEQLVQNFAFFDEYDVQDGETPEIVADLFYNNPQLHWIILHANEIIDPRFEWPLDEYNLYRITLTKYSNADATHHYVNNSGNVINGNVLITSNAEFGDFRVGDVITNNTNFGVGVITHKGIQSLGTFSAMFVLVSSGGFNTGDTILLSSNSSLSANIVGAIPRVGIPVSNFEYESNLNEQRRRIKIIKPQLVSDIINNFETIITR